MFPKGSRVYYESDARGRREGIVADPPRGYAKSEDVVWAYWAGSTRPLTVPAHQVHLVQNLDIANPDLLMGFMYVHIINNQIEFSAQPIEGVETIAIVPWTEGQGL